MIDCSNVKFDHCLHSNPQPEENFYRNKKQCVTCNSCAEQVRKYRLHCKNNGPRKRKQKRDAYIDLCESCTLPDCIRKEGELCGTVFDRQYSECLVSICRSNNWTVENTIEWIKEKEFD